MLTIACSLVVRLGLGLGLDLVSGYTVDNGYAHVLCYLSLSVALPEGTAGVNGRREVRCSRRTKRYWTKTVHREGNISQPCAADTHIVNVWLQLKHWVYGRHQLGVAEQLLVSK